MISFKRTAKQIAKPICTELVTTTTNEVTERIERHMDDSSDIIELGIMAVALVASVVLPHNPIVTAARTLLAIPSSYSITEIGRF